MNKPILILIDIQREYTTKDRPFYLNNIEKSLQNCKNILAFARENTWEIIHIKHLKMSAPIFNPNSEFSEFAEGFEPITGEKIFIKDLYSCYSSKEFSKLMEENKNSEVIIIGYNSIMCCLSTVIEGYHRRHNLLFVEDASLAKSTPEFSEEDMHVHSISLIKTANYAKVIKTDDIIMCS